MLAGAAVAALIGLAAVVPAAPALVVTPPPGTFTQVSAGPNHACAVRTSGELLCFDAAGNTLPSPAGTYRQVSLNPWEDAACALRSDQTLVCFRRAFTDPTPAGTFLAVSVGAHKACALRTDQTLVCWGDPFQFPIPELVPPPAGTFTAVEVGKTPFPEQACALSAAQTITCWGFVPSPGPPAGTFTALDDAGFGGCALRPDQTVACWGSDVGGDTVPPAGAFVSLSKIDGQTCGVRVDHTVACWGIGILSAGAAPGGTFTQVSIGGQFACGVRTDQTLACWPGAATAGPPPVPPAPGAPAPPAASTAAAPAPRSGARLPRLPVAFGANGVFSLPSNRSCVSRRNFRIRVRRQRAGVTLVSAAIAVNGRRVAVRRGARLTAPVDLRGLPKGRFTVRISALTADGRAIVGTRRYRTCAARRASGGHGPLVLAAATVGRGGRAAAATGVPVLGTAFLGSAGFGHAHPKGLEEGQAFVVERITWKNWGAAQSVGLGKALYVPPGKHFSEGVLVTAKMVAYDLGTCRGRRAYLKMDWWEPGRTKRAHFASNGDGTAGSLCSLG
jgi:hypothetical protein